MIFKQIAVLVICTQINYAQLSIIFTGDREQLDVILTPLCLLMSYANCFFTHYAYILVKSTELEHRKELGGSTLTAANYVKRVKSLILLKLCQGFDELKY